LRDEAGVDTVSFEHGYIENLPFEDGTFDAVVSNGVINLSAEKERVFDVGEVRENTEYEFIPDRAANACQKYGVKSVSLGARKR
jgi:hypothetical protein